MKYLRTSLLSFLIALLFVSGMIVSVSADENDTSEAASSFEESFEETSAGDSGMTESSTEEISVTESSIEEISITESSVVEVSVIESSVEEISITESSIVEISVIESSPGEISETESSVGEISLTESSIEESSTVESSSDENSFPESSVDESSTAASIPEESSSEENSADESNASETSRSRSGHSSATESSVAVQPAPENDPLRWMAEIRVILPADRESGKVQQNSNEEISYILPPAEPEDDEGKLAELSTVPAEPIDEVPTAITTQDDKKGSKTQFLIGIIIFSAIGMVLTLSLILFMRSKRERSMLFRKKRKL